ncbi:MAG: alpha-1,4-glucan--maltose-1-phosphate maltosyltransferase [Candidatus Omnitrophota bacterium]
MVKRTTSKEISGNIKESVNSLSLKVPSSLSDNRRIIIENVMPRVDGVKFPVKRVIGERVVVRADVFADGHDKVLAFLLFREAGAETWQRSRMTFLENDAWSASFMIEKQTNYVFTVRGFISEFSTWLEDLKKKVASGLNVALDLQIGAKIIRDAVAHCPVSESEKLLTWASVLEKPHDMAKAISSALEDELLLIMENSLDVARSVTFEPEITVEVDRARALFSSWYEIFPRSWSKTPGAHGTFCECEQILPEIARMGFDVLYLPPVHPVGISHRKGKNNSTTCNPDEPGCPWAIGGIHGGHKAIHPQLGTIVDFKSFVKRAQELKMEVALDIAFQCSPDHPYVKDHPSWFKWRPDGTVQYAENPPKKYEDVLPFNFETPDWRDLWEELKSVFLFWAANGVRIFRVDNPHTKPFLFWDWVIAGVKAEYPDAIFLAEAFTRPKIMYRLGKAGFSQSYTYFTWRNTKKEFEDYLTELSQTNVAEFFRPNFWPNTPDILPEHLQYGNRAMFMIRAALASTMSSNWGIYGPAFELCLTQAYPGKEEYIDNEKYEIKSWDWDRQGNIKDFITSLNRIRKENLSLQMTRNIHFCRILNDQIIAFFKATGDYSNIVVVLVNLDSTHQQSGWLDIPWLDLGLNKDKPLQAQELLSGEKVYWQGEKAFVDLDPKRCPVQIFRISQ